MFYNHTEAWGIVWGPPKCDLCHRKCLGACNSWQFVLDMWRDSVTCRQVATFSESKYYVPVVTGNPADWRHLPSDSGRGVSEQIVKW